MYLLIDNFDSFTYNLVHLFGEVGAEVLVFRNNELTVDEVFNMKPEAIVLSPGPCDPDQAGICLGVTERAAQTQTPLMGVCLGHQTIGQSFGGKVCQANAIMHGKMGTVQHQDSGLFAGIPAPFEATRYHSLTVERESLPDCLNITASTEDGTIMGLSHQTLPIHGVQFHPESIASEHGHAIIRNFMSIVAAHNV